MLLDHNVTLCVTRSHVCLALLFDDGKLTVPYRQICCATKLLDFVACLTSALGQLLHRDKPIISR